METETKQYAVPEEVHQLFLDGLAAQKCRDIAIKTIFRAKRAIYYEKMRREKIMKAWDLVQELWPELIGCGLSYNTEKRVVEIKPTS